VTLPGYDIILPGQTFAQLYGHFSAMFYRIISTVTFISVAFLLVNCGQPDEGNQTEAELIQQQVRTTQSAHGIEAWWQKELIQADVKIDFGGNRIVDGTFTFEAHGPRSRYDRKQGGPVVYDGKTAWMLDPAASENNARFHVLTWPWFIMAPFKMEGDGIDLSDYQAVQFDGEQHCMIKQSFASDMGDAPDDWYRFIINAETNRINAMIYIVTYGKTTEEANAKPSIIYYKDYKEYEGTFISTVYEFWYWDEGEFDVSGDSPKGVGTVSNIRYVSNDPKMFQVSADAVELKLPDGL